ncbi:hypothetical protein Vi05172_g7576 [Venturia inaequalis]|nr:hypothetical protein Vi05172_g7576 [Venturia inaequalis]
MISSANNEDGPVGQLILPRQRRLKISPLASPPTEARPHPSPSHLLQRRESLSTVLRMPQMSDQRWQESPGEDADPPSVI